MFIPKKRLDNIENQLKTTKEKVDYIYEKQIPKIHDVIDRILSFLNVETKHIPSIPSKTIYVAKKKQKARK